MRGRDETNAFEKEGGALAFRVLATMD